MTTQNDFLPFATGPGANVVDQATYAALTALTTGFLSGTAQSMQLNKVWRQSSIMSAVVAQFIVAQTGQAAVDDGTTPTLLANFTKAVNAASKQRVILTDTGSVNTVAAANAVPMTALPTVSGIVQTVAVKVTNTGAATYSPDGLAARPIFGLGGAALQGGEMVANGLATLVSYVGPLLNGGVLCWVLLECIGGAQQVAPAIASQHAVQLSQVRQRLSANTTFYVNASTGSDSNSGLSSGAAFATIQRAWDVISRNYDLNGFVATVNIANGSYGALNASGGPPNSFYDGAIVFNGNTASPGSVTMTSNNVSGTAFAQGAFFTIQGVTLTSSGGSNSMFAAVGGRIIFNNVIFGSSAQSHIVASGGGSAVATGPYTISGGASNHYSTDTGGLIFVSGQTVTLSGTPSFSTAFALVRWCAVLAVTSTTFTGSASGARYSVIGNGVVTGTGGSATYLPGSVAGSTASGGQYT